MLNKKNRVEAVNSLEKAIQNFEIEKRIWLHNQKNYIKKD